MRVASNLHRLAAQPQVLFALHRALTTTNPGGEPDNGEAVRPLGSNPSPSPDPGPGPDPSPSTRPSPALALALALAYP